MISNPLALTIGVCYAQLTNKWTVTACIMIMHAIIVVMDNNCPALLSYDMLFNTNSHMFYYCFRNARSYNLIKLLMLIPFGTGQLYIKNRML